MRKAFIYMAVAAFFAVSCNSAKIESPALYGKLSVSLAQDAEVVVKTKATLTAKQAQDYNIAVYTNEACSGNPILGSMKHSEFGTQSVAVGTYYVAAESCTETEAEASNGQMRLAGVSNAVTVTTDAPATAQVDCEVSNALVTVAYDSDTVYDADGTCRFTGLKVTLSSTMKTAEVAASKTDVVHWFNPCTLTYKITGTYTATGKNVSYESTQQLSAKSNIKLLVMVNLDNGTLTPSVTVDTDLTQTNINQEFNPYN